MPGPARRHLCAVAGGSGRTLSRDETFGPALIDASPRARCSIPPMLVVERNRFKLWYARLAAGVTWAMLLLQLGLSIQISWRTGHGAWHGVWMYFAFFTILTNWLAAFALASASLGRSGTVLTAPGIVTGIAASMVLVGAAYNLLLRNFWNPHGLQLLADVVLHDVTPV